MVGNNQGSCGSVCFSSFITHEGGKNLKFFLLLAYITRRVEQQTKPSRFLPLLFKRVKHYSWCVILTKSINKLLTCFTCIFCLFAIATCSHTVIVWKPKATSVLIDCSSRMWKSAGFLCAWFAGIQHVSTCKSSSMSLGWYFFIFPEIPWPEHRHNLWLRDLAKPKAQVLGADSCPCCWSCVLLPKERCEAWSLGEKGETSGKNHQTAITELYSCYLLTSSSCRKIHKVQTTYICITCFRQESEASKILWGGREMHTQGRISWSVKPTQTE